MASSLFQRTLTLYQLQRTHFSHWKHYSQHCSRVSYWTGVVYVVNAADLLPITPGNKFCKYADDTCLIIPADNVNTRMAEINNIKTWACASNLALNLTKTVEIVFVNSKRRRQVQPPSPLATVSRVSSLKVRCRSANTFPQSSARVRNP